MAKVSEEAIAIINDARAYAKSLIPASTSAMKAATSAVDMIPSVMLNVAPTQLYEGTGYGAGAISNPPAVPRITITLPKYPTSLGATGSIPDLDIDLNSIPSMDVAFPTLLEPSPPSSIAAFQGVIPSVNLSVSFPTPPAEMSVAIEVPVFTDHDIPVAPTVFMPVFEAVTPIDESSPSADLPEKMMSTYKDMAPKMTATIDRYVEAFIRKTNPSFNLAQAALEKKYEQFLLGGTAVSEDVYNAVVEIEKDKSAAEFRRNAYAARDASARMGFSMPNGAVQVAYQQARQAYADNLARSARDEKIEMFKMEQANVQFAMSESRGYRTTILNVAMSYFSGLMTINGQALDSAKNVVSAYVAMYNAQIERYKAALEGYKAEASVYEAKIRGALGEVELYKVQIQAFEALVNVDKVKIDIYRGRISCLEAYAGIYKISVDTVVRKAELEKLKIDLFGVQIESYKATVSGKALEHEAYKAALSSNESRVRAYVGQIEGESKKVDVFKAIVDAKSRVIESKAKGLELVMRGQEAELRAYQILVNAEGDKAKIEVEIAKMPFESYRLQLQAEIARIQRDETKIKATNDMRIKNADLNAQVQFKQADLWAGKGKAVAEISTNQSQIAAAAAQGAINGINAFVSLSG